MRIGTKSVLFGAHQFLIHPWFVAAAWGKLYGFPWDPRLWVAFFVHDLGYIGKPNMDGEEGERHVEFGARLMSILFDPSKPSRDFEFVIVNSDPKSRWLCGPWGQFSLFHSRFYAKKYCQKYSRLCVADKLAIALTPAWLYLPLARLTGEIHEYMALAQSRNLAGEPNKYSSMTLWTGDQRRWYSDVQRYVRRWVEEHKDGREDSWTPKVKTANTESGVWK